MLRLKCFDVYNNVTCLSVLSCSEWQPPPEGHSSHTRAHGLVFHAEGHDVLFGHRECDSS